MRRSMFIAAVTAASLGLWGCNFLGTVAEFNIFRDIDAPSVPTAAEFLEMDDDELLDSLDRLTESDSFYDDLDDETKSAILDGLDDIYAGAPPAEPGTDLDNYQRAALYAAAIELNTSEGAEVIDSIIEVLFDADGSSSGNLVEDILTSAFAGVPQSEFAATVAALQNAAAAYIAFGNSLLDIDGDGEADPPPGVNIGAIAQEALIAVVVASVIGELGASDVEQFVYGGDPLDSAPSNPVDDPVNPAYTALNNILDAAGLTETFSGLP